MVASIHVVTRDLNSYSLETLIGAPIKGCFSARRLQRFLPREGTELARAQNEVKERCCKEGEEQEKTDLRKIEAEQVQERVDEESEVETTSRAAGKNDNEDDGFEEEGQAEKAGLRS